VQHLVFASDAGASLFLREPTFAAQACVEEETGPLIGQETHSLHVRYQLQLSDKSVGTAEGHAALIRCGRVVITVVGVGTPGQFAETQVNDLARKVQGDFAKVQPC
jgi:hypothetical protein